MNKSIFNIVAALLILGIVVQVFTSCFSNDDDDEIEGTSSPSKPSSSSKPSGSGTGKSSSSVKDNSKYGDPVTYGDETYQTVIIGEQTWFKRNLSYDPGKGNYTTDSYGRKRYDWATAMDLPLECNQNSCVEQIKTNHKGICPEGFHIPTYADWGKLFQYVIVNMVGDYDEPVSYLRTYERYTSSIYGDYSEYLDTYGFSAVGIGSTPTGWWTSEVVEGNSISSKMKAYKVGTYMYLGFTEVKSEKYSIRCLKNSSDTNPPKIPEKKSLTDARDNQTYKTIKIGRQNWMAENLNYDAEGSKCYESKEANCTTYGKLYSWATAMDLPSKCNSVLSSDTDCNKNKVHRGVCPSGWHLPSSDEWSELLYYVQCGLGTLKANNGWSDYGADTYGFSALPGGQINESGFSQAGDMSYWWSTDEVSFAPNQAFNRSYDGKTPLSQDREKSNLYSIRCLQD